MTDYSLIDRPFLLKSLFFPRQEHIDPPPPAYDRFIPVEDNVSIGCRFYPKEEDYPWILYFHGNGEVVSDYDEIAPLYNQHNMNLVVADYRGYGASGGEPAFANLIKDAHRVYEDVRGELKEKEGFSGLWIMGRSLGSISALELAYHYGNEIEGLIIESGFISAVRLIKHFNLLSPGIDLDKLDRQCLDMVKEIEVPALIIHGQQDRIVPLEEGKDLYKNLGSSLKEMEIIPYADHNNIMFLGLDQYFMVINKFMAKISRR
ncbi:MAG: alpha/beta hydrolase [Candidatus Syntrophonatronum acetioxidans]|uniref:Alpha/beta hydrolase n=1 Tax=Candidatus Syntrophonatronum acetioxidans TaxID=1795816 RepID=A0A424YAW2_9FIRM|nr:MAG: alpha/beta hydrolase [Candidatus Syntrophonatronum acetioxidans]